MVFVVFRFFTQSTTFGSPPIGVIFVICHGARNLIKLKEVTSFLVSLEMTSSEEKVDSLKFQSKPKT